MNYKLIPTSVLCCALISTSLCARAQKKNDSQKKEDAQPAQRYTKKTFDFKDVTFSPSQLEQHVKLYEGYVKKNNEIETSLQTADRSNVANITYSPFRALKIAETFAHNGRILHELYFENLGMDTEMGKETKKLITQHYGSVDAFKEDLIACASCARGWVLTCYCLEDNTLYNFVLDAHNETVPVLVIPLLVVDIYEHAYMIDYGINRAQYLKDLWNNINWDVVEQRVVKWLKKLQ